MHDWNTIAEDIYEYFIKHEYFVKQGQPRTYIILEIYINLYKHDKKNYNMVYT